MRKWYLLFLLLMGLGSLQVHAQMLNAGQFPGFTVGDKVAAAQTQGCISGMACAITIPADLSLWPQGTMPTRCANCAWIDYRTAGQVTYQSASNSVSNIGVFSNTQMNEYAQSVLNGGSSLSEYQASQGGTNFATNAHSAIVNIPSSATVQGSNGYFGAVLNNSTTTFGVGGQFSARAGANGVKIEGANTIFLDNGKTGVTGASLEADCNVSVSGTSGQCLQINGSFTGSPTSFPALNVAAPVGGGKWSAGYQSQDGSTNNGISLGAQGSSNAGSQAILLTGRDAGGLAHTAVVQTNLNGQLNLTPAAGNPVAIQGQLYVSLGVSNSGTGLQHKRVAGCATAATAGSVCTTTVTWNSAFADTSYTAACSGDVITSGVPADGGFSAKAAASITFRTVAVTAAAAQYTTIDCVAMHD